MKRRPKVNLPLESIKLYIDQIRNERHRLPFLLDHHAGHAWARLWRWAWYGPDVAIPGDTYKRWADMLCRLPEYLDSRVQPLLAGLRLEADPEGRYEARYTDILRHWDETMSLAYRLTEGSVSSHSLHKVLVCMYWEAAQWVIPEFGEWLGSIRNAVCDGAQGGRWKEGDEYREYWLHRQSIQTSPLDPRTNPVIGRVKTSKAIYKIIESLIDDLRFDLELDELAAEIHKCCKLK